MKKLIQRKLSALTKLTALAAHTTLILLCLFAKNSYAVEYEFQSKLDKFKVEVSEGHAYFEQQPVDEEPFAFIQPLFEAQLIDPCPSNLGRPDLTIVREGGDKRLIYTKKKITSNGANCANVKGQGIYSLPLHRNWFTGAKKATISIGNSFRIVKNGHTVVEYERAPTGWRSRDTKFFTNWVFFEKFLDALVEYPISYRVHEDAVKELTTFELEVDGKKKFVFAKVGARTWAVRVPGSLWLAASSHFGIFEDMSQTIWISPHDKTLRLITDPTAKSEKRIQNIRNLVDNWGPDVKYAFHGVLLTAGEETNIRQELVTVLRNYPSDENMRVLVYALRTTEDHRLLHQLTKTLLVRNPKGPTIQEDDDEQVRHKKINYWFDWAKTLTPNTW